MLLAGAATSIIFVATNTCLHVCRDKTHLFVAAQICLSRQNFCHDKIMFGARNICHNKSFVTTKYYIEQMILVAAAVGDKYVSHYCKRVQKHWMSQSKRLGS